MLRLRTLRSHKLVRRAALRSATDTIREAGSRKLHSAFVEPELYQSPAQAPCATSKPLPLLFRNLLE